MSSNTIFTQQTGTNNPFGHIDVGSDAAPVMYDVDQDGDLDLVVAKDGPISGGDHIDYFENEGGQFVQKFYGENPFDDIDLGYVGNIRIEFVPKNETEDYLVISTSDNDSVTFYEQGSNGYQLVPEDNSPLTFLPPEISNFFWDYNVTVLEDINGNDAPELIFVHDSHGDVKWFEGVEASTGNYEYQMRGDQDLDNPFRQFNIDTDDSPYHNINQDDGWQGVWIPTPFIITDVIISGSKTRVTGVTELNIGDDRFLVLGHSHLDSFPDHTIYEYRPQTNDWELVDGEEYDTLFGNLASVGNRATPYAVDFDGDGDEDLLVGTRDGVIRFFLNTGEYSQVSVPSSSPPTDNPPSIDNSAGGDSVSPTTGNVDSASPATDNGNGLSTALFTGTASRDVFRGKNSADVMHGKGGRDRLFGGNGADTLNGGNGDDLLIGGNGNDRINGGKGNDRVKGGKGRDRINGGPGDDTLLGGNGNDHLVGGSGNDRLIGGKGNDKLTGGSGDDLFVLSIGDRRDRITDFVIGEDTLGIRGGQSLDLDDVQFIQQGRNAVVRLGGEAIASLKNTNAAELVAAADTTVVLL
ncbi:MAG: calcium-binding protein [Cyanobacteria bacterium P01_F01_bin.150]